MLALSVGQIVADKYRIDRVIGAGGMGVVVAATHVELDQRVAIKFLRDANDDSIARFKREARLLVKLKSQHVARVFDVGSLDDDTPFIVMELLEGQDLSTVLTEAGGRLSVEDAIDYVLEASEAVAEAHVLGMVHRDLKPANLFLARGPGGSVTVKVLDFGVSKMLDAKAEAEQTYGAGALTNEGVALGSPGYMAPEQMTSSRDVDARADIYSLGAMLYRLVSGQNPYKGNSLVSVLAAMAMDPLPPLKSLIPEVPDGFAAIVEKCLAQERDDRFETVAHLANALAPFATRRGKTSAEQVLATMNIPLEPFGSTVVRPLTISSSHAARPSTNPPPDPPPPPPDRSWMYLAAGGLFLGVTLVLLFGWNASHPKPVEPPPPATVTSTSLPPPPPPLPPLPATLPMPTTEPTTVPPPVTTPPKSPPKPAVGATRKPPPHGHPTPPSTAPPSPTEVPAGRL